MRTLPYALAAVLAAGAGATLLSADEPPAPAPAPQPAPETAKASSEDILRWIADLASDDFRTREAASKRLQDAGESARAALESVAKTSDSLEVRWRAEQLLLRLDASGERPLGRFGEPGTPGLGGSERERTFRDASEEMRAAWEEFLRRFNRPGDGFTPFGVPGADDPFAAFATTLRSGDLTLMLPMFGRGAVRLKVTAKDGTSATHTGKNLDEILAAHPELKDAPGMADLQKQLADRQKRADALRQGFGTGPLGTTIHFRTNGVEAVQDANGAVVRITEKGPDGKETTKEFKGATLDEIKAKHPEIAHHLNGMGSFKIHIGPRLFNGPREGGLAPLTPPALPQPVTPAAEGAVFGVGLGPVEPVLALHLGLENGRGVVVEHVAPDSQAAQLGIERYDVIETIDGSPVLAWEQARQLLRAAAKDKAPLTLGIIRTGKRQTLSR